MVNATHNRKTDTKRNITLAVSAMPSPTVTKHAEPETVYYTVEGSNTQVAIEVSDGRAAPLEIVTVDGNKATDANGHTFKVVGIDVAKPDVQGQLAQAIAADAGQPDNALALALAEVSRLTNANNALQVELATKAVPAKGNALIPMAQFGTARRRGGPASAREVQSFTSKRHLGIVPQLAPNHYVDLAAQNDANVANMVIKLLVAHNPKRQVSATRFAKYRNGQTVAAYIEACKHISNAYVCLRDLAYDCNRQFIALLPAGSKVGPVVGLTPFTPVGEPRAATTLGQSPIASAEVAQRLAVLRASLQQ